MTYLAQVDRDHNNGHLSMDREFAVYYESV